MKLLSVDFQNDFVSKGGLAYRPRACVHFIGEVLLPWLRSHDTRLAEIVSDYRLPRPGDEFECCVPGTWGYASRMPDDQKLADIWVKCMNSPEWVRDNGGDAGRSPGLPRPDPASFSAWLRRALGAPEEAGAVVLVGLTLDCCVLCTAQSLAHRAYDVRYLVEGVDTFDGSAGEKEHLLRTAAANWGKAMTWDECRLELERGAAA